MVPPGVADMYWHLPLVTVVADPTLAGDQYGSEPVCFVYPVLVAVVFRIGCAVLVWESGMAFPRRTVGTR